MFELIIWLGIPIWTLIPHSYQATSINFLIKPLQHLFQHNCFFILLQLGWHIQNFLSTPFPPISNSSFIPNSFYCWNHFYPFISLSKNHYLYLTVYSPFVGTNLLLQLRSFLPLPFLQFSYLSYHLIHSSEYSIRLRWFNNNLMYIYKEY